MFYDFHLILGIAYKFITTDKKKRLLMLNGYTFAQSARKRLYYCSKMCRNKCKASVKLDGNGMVERLKEEHNHAAPRYLRTAHGLYVMLSR